MTQNSTVDTSDWIDMSPSKGGTGESTFEAEPGTYQFKLIEITIDQGTDYEDKTKTFPQARFVWEDADGDRFLDSFNKVPMGLKLNEKAAWTNRLSALVGRPLTEEDKVQIKFSSPFVRTYDELAEAVSDRGDNGRGVVIKVEGIAFQGQLLYGREALLTLGWNAKKSHLKCGGQGAAPVPNAGGKKKKSAVADAPAPTSGAEPVVPTEQQPY